MQGIKKITNEGRQVSEIVSMINNGFICKDKFQRPMKWSLNGETKGPSVKEYIKFLFKRSNSINPIIFGLNDGIYSNVDGNNRLNSLKLYTDQPFKIFPEIFSELVDFINETYHNQKTKDFLIETFREMNYDKLSSFNYYKYFTKTTELPDGISWDNHLKENRDKFDEFYQTYAENFLTHDKKYFNSVIINLTICENFSIYELNEMYTEVNKYTKTMTQMELQASYLFDTKGFKIENEIIKKELDSYCKKFYEERSKEALKCYNYDDKMNGYDFLTAIDCLFKNESEIIKASASGKKTTPSALTLSFRLFNVLYKLSPENFTTVNVNKFLSSAKKAVIILEKTRKNLFNYDKLEKKGKTKFYTSSIKQNECERYLINVVIFVYIERNFSEKEILNIIEQTIFYNYIKRYFKDRDELKMKYNVKDFFDMGGGGVLVDAAAISLKECPYRIVPKNIENASKMILEDISTGVLDIKQPMFILSSNYVKKTFPEFYKD